MLAQKSQSAEVVLYRYFKEKCVKGCFVNISLFLNIDGLSSNSPSIIVVICLTFPSLTVALKIFIHEPKQVSTIHPYPQINGCLTR